MAPTVVWLKRDLRLHDHVPLCAAAASGPVVVLYAYEPKLWQRPEYDACHLHFVNQSLSDLNRSLQERGTQVTFRTGAMRDILTALHRDLQPLGGIGRIVSHQETGIGWTFGRDRAVQAWCDQHGVRWQQTRQDGVFRGLKSRDGWAKAFKAEMTSSIPLPPEQFTCVSRFLPWDPGVQQSAEALGLPPTTAIQLQPGGESLGRANLNSFLSERAPGYSRAMSSPLTGETGCSRMSPHLAWGTVSLRTVYQKMARRQQTAKRRREGPWLSAMESFESRLFWRGHYIQKLESQADSEFLSLHPATRGLRPGPVAPEDIEARFQAWSTGRTGYPMIDAVIRSLHAMKWTTFRMRSMAVSFASYDLWIPWRRTALHLAPHFLDFEPGIHFSQVQMQSGTTGINQLRIYNPTKQARDQDPSGVFIKRWIPELRQLPAAYIHTPWDLPPMFAHLRGDYPDPIVEHEAATRVARKRLERARGSVDGRCQSRQINQRHGSRRPRHRRTWRS